MGDGVPVVSEDDDSDVVSFKIEGHAPDAGSELDHFSCLDLVEANHSGNTVSNTDDSAELLDIVLGEVRGTTWEMFMIFSWMTFAVSAIPSFLELKP